jgi:mutator protein MutT
VQFPVSVKGVLFQRGVVVLLENERAEWELPGGRLEPGETPEECLAREIAEELGCVVKVGPLLDCWVYEVVPARRVVIITYGVERPDEGNLRLSQEHKALGFFSVEQIAEVALPIGYRRAIVRWAAAQDAG